MKVIVGITGASGSVYAVKLLRTLKALGVEVTVICSEMGIKVMEYECGISGKEIFHDYDAYENSDLFAPVASGSNKWDAMIIVPCSINTLGAIANGIGNSLLLRVASVTLKENRKLITVVRETPLSFINLRNMCTLSQAGCCIMPASPGFYGKPRKIDDLIDSLVARMLDELGIENSMGNRWKGDENETGRQGIV